MSCANPTYIELVLQDPRASLKQPVLTQGREVAVIVLPLIGSPGRRRRLTRLKGSCLSIHARKLDLKTVVSHFETVRGNRNCGSPSMYPPLFLVRGDISLRKRRQTPKNFPRKPEDIDLRLPFSQSPWPGCFSRSRSLVNAAQFVGAAPLMDWRNHPSLATESPSSSTAFLPFLLAPVYLRSIFCIRFITLSFRISPPTPLRHFFVHSCSDTRRCPSRFSISRNWLCFKVEHCRLLFC